MSAASSLVFDTFRKKLLSGLGWNVISTVGLQGAVLLASIFVARLLSLDEFGIYSILVSTVMMAAGMAQSGAGLVGTKFVGEYLHTDPRRVGRILRMCELISVIAGTLMAMLLFVMADVVAVDILGQPEIESYLRWVCVAIVFQVVVAYQYGALQGFGAFRQLSKVGVVAGLLYLLVIVLGVWSGGLKGALLGFVIASAIRVSAFTLTLRQVCRQHKIPKTIRILPEDWRLIWSFALPASLASLVTLPCLWGVTALVARQPDGLVLVALFSVAHQIRLLVLQLPSLLNGVSFSVLSRLKGLGEEASFKHVFWTNMAVSLAFAVALVALIAVFVDEVLGLYGPQFLQGRHLLLILLVAVISEVLANTAYQLVQSSGRMWSSLLLIVGPRDLVYLLLAAIWLPYFGLQGAAWAYLVAYTLGCMATILLGRSPRTLNMLNKVVP